MNNNEPIKATISTHEDETKIRFFIGDRKYAFRCTAEELEHIHVEEGALIPEVSFQ